METREPGRCWVLCCPHPATTQVYVAAPWRGDLYSQVRVCDWHARSAAKVDAEPRRR